MTVCVVPSQDGGSKNCCVELYLQWAQRDLQRRAAVQLLSDLMFEPLFDELRTKQQLGYSVHNTFRESVHVLGFSIVVQSSNTPPAEIMKRIEIFLVWFRERLAAMSTSQFGDHRFALASSLLEPERSLGAQHGLRYAELENQRREVVPGKYVFDRPARLAAALRGVGKAAVLATLDAFVARTARRRGLCVVVIGGQHAGAGETVEALREEYAGAVTVVAGPQELHASAGFFPPEADGQVVLDSPEFVRSQVGA